jgi:hypothetical protein
MKEVRIIRERARESAATQCRTAPNLSPAEQV